MNRDVDNILATLSPFAVNVDMPELEEAVARLLERNESNELAQVNAQGYFTKRQIAAAAGRSYNWADKRLRALRDQGYRIEVVHVHVHGIDGRRYLVPAYRIPREQKKEGE